MRFMFMIFAAFMMVCVAFAHQENSMALQDYPEEPDDSRVVRQASNDRARRQALENVNAMAIQDYPEEPDDSRVVRQARAAHPQTTNDRAKRQALENVNSMEIQDYPEEPDDSRVVRQARDAHLMNYIQASNSRAKRLVQQDTPKPTPPPAGNFDEIDLSGFPIGSG